MPTNAVPLTPASSVFPDLLSASVGAPRSTLLLILQTCCGRTLSEYLHLAVLSSSIYHVPSFALDITQLSLGYTHALCELSSQKDQSTQPIKKASGVYHILNSREPLSIQELTEYHLCGNPNFCFLSAR
ncbi:hypothetical protein QCA50_000324 [Cerrena zonata]|uniref:Uncharacterized protein n=1 Tax=Cerrena zonata TaxID=2478898 RepID=A0AAW0GXQ4_9APHY